ncbi:APC family permease [Mycobacterium sp.]|uniref:APC family permease n=1 Tax=Mycobacterium sp. TaxID=1785 RepID=UPI002C53B718|nr:APC family permease [Mycobacterium sp.]HXB85818.1 APC family permease [Mycobacterium sp.]
MVETLERAPHVHRIPDPRFRRHHKGDSHRLTAFGGLAAMSLDALSSVAYGPEAIVLGLVVAGAAAVSFTVPISIAIAVLLLVLVISYRQVIAVHPDGGGSYAVAKKDLGRGPALLAAASLVVDYVLTVAVSLSAGADSLASVFPPLAHHGLALCLAGLAILAVINLVGIAESAKVLMGPTLLFIAGMFAIIIFGFFEDAPVKMIGDFHPIHATEALGVVVILKAFSAGCSSLTGVEAIANAVPAFRSPAVKRAQRCEIALGVLLGAMLLGLAVQIRLHHVVPRDNVTILAQLSAGAFGTGWPFYVINLSVTLVLAFAANTSFGGLPVLLQLLARDHRLPHMFALRAEKPVFRYGVTALALLAAAVLAAVNADTQRLLPVFAIGVFIGFTISQTGLVLHWRRERGPRWQGYILLNGFGAILTAVAGIVLFASKFTEGAWLLLILVPSLILLFDRIERYYRYAAVQLGLGKVPVKPERGVDTQAMIVVPIVAVSCVAERAVQAALRMGGEVVPITVEVDPDSTQRVVRQWQDWDPGVELTVLPSPHRSLVTPTINFVRSEIDKGRHVTVLLAQVSPKHWRHRLLYNQRGPLLEAALRTRTDAIIASLAIHID